MDGEEGWKISRFVPDGRQPDYASPEDSARILKTLRRLHTSGIKVDYGLSPWEDAEAMEHLLTASVPGCFDSFLALKEKVRRVYQSTLGDGIEKCFCHGDTYRPNWILREDGTTILIDWEYAGYSDPGIDVGYYIVDAMYSEDRARAFILEYLQADEQALWSGPDSAALQRQLHHYLAYTCLIAYYWFVWALYRASCGADMGQALSNWRLMADTYADLALK